jgi:hypothetical protein
VVKIIGDRIREGNETFFFTISKAVDSEKVRIGDETAVGTIRNND